MKLIYKFTEDERRVIAVAQARVVQTLQVIADLHKIEGNLGLAPDGSGFVQTVNSGTPDQPPGD